MSWSSIGPSIAVLYWAAGHGKDPLSPAYTRFIFSLLLLPLLLGVQPNNTVILPYFPTIRFSFSFLS